MRLATSISNAMEAVNNGRYKTDGSLRKMTKFGQFSRDTSAWIHQVSINDAGFPTVKFSYT